MNIWDLLLLAMLGAVAGTVNVLAGGGSLITLPVMVFLGLDGPQANGSNRIAILSQCVAAVTGFFHKGFSDFKLSLTLSLCALPGAVIGAWYGTQLRGVWFNRTLALVMLVVMVLMARKKPVPVDPAGGTSRRRIVLGHLLMLGVGLYGGFIQAGVGFLLMAVLYRVMGIDLVRVNMHKVFIAATFNLAALFIFQSRGLVLWQVGVALALGQTAGGWIGSHLSVNKGETLIKRVMYAALIAMAIKLLMSNHSG